MAATAAAPLQRQGERRSLSLARLLFKENPLGVIRNPIDKSPGTHDGNRLGDRAKSERCDLGYAAGNCAGREPSPLKRPGPSRKSTALTRAEDGCEVPVRRNFEGLVESRRHDGPRGQGSSRSRGKL